MRVTKKKVPKIEITNNKEDFMTVKKFNILVKKNLSVETKKAKGWLKRKGVTDEFKRIKEDDSQVEGAGKKTRVYFGIKVNDQETAEETNDIVPSTEQEEPQSEEKKEEYINICNDLDQM